MTNETVTEIKTKQWQYAN